MLFRTREKPDLSQRLRVAVWPRVSWSRSARYYKERVIRLAGEPHAIALGVAIGVGIAFTPFLGFHILIGLPIAYFVGGNLIATAIGTAFANPLTLPFIWASSYRLGRMMLGAPHVRGEEDITHGLAAKSFDAVWPILKPMIVGSVPLGLVAAVIAYFVVYNAVRVYRTVRGDRIAARRRERNGGDGKQTMENA